MKSIILALILAPCALLASCEHKCQPAPEMTLQRCESPLVEYDGHLWKAIMLEHSSLCGCDEMKEDKWPDDDLSPHEKEAAYY